MGDLTIAEVQAVYQTGIWLILASAAMFGAAMAVVKLLPRYVLYAVIPAWILGAAGFVLICVFDVHRPDWFNIGLGIVFAIASASQGYRLHKRSRAHAEDERGDGE